MAGGLVGDSCVLARETLLKVGYLGAPERDGVLILLFISTASLAQIFTGHPCGGALGATAVALSVILLWARSCALCQAGKSMWAERPLPGQSPLPAISWS